MQSRARLNGLRFAWSLCTYAAGVAVWVAAASLEAGLRAVVPHPVEEHEMSWGEG